MKTLYHGTSSLNVPSIKKLGIVPGHAKGSDAWAKEHHWGIAKLAAKLPPTVCLSDLHVKAEDFARLSVEELGGTPVVITIEVPAREFAKYEVDELFDPDAEHPHAWRAHAVSPLFITSVTAVTHKPSAHFLEMKLLAEMLA